MEIWEQLERKIKDLERSVKLLAENGKKYAESERAYKIALGQAALRLRDGGMPVTLIDKTVYGEADVADARFARDAAEAVYKANQEAINSLKLQIRILHDQNTQDWGAAKF